MSISNLNHAPVLVVGAGTMGVGIVQVAVQAGHTVQLYDMDEGLAHAGKKQLAAVFDMLVGKGRISAESAQDALARIEPIKSLNEAACAKLVIEAIVENVNIKRELFQVLEDIVSVDCILASNTSSISITALGNGLQHPERIVGMHFFNPVALMKLVEIVAGLQTERKVAEVVFDLSEKWGKTAVRCRSTPGFIVNRVARPFYAETLALLQEQASTHVELDACLRGAGFRMGPCLLMDLIGHDVNDAVTRSVYEANYFDKRFMPSLVQAELVEGGFLGRKSGQGFYHYKDKLSNKAADQNTMPASTPAGKMISVHGDDALSEKLVQTLKRLNYPHQQIVDSSWTGLQINDAQLRLSNGLPASYWGGDVAVFDWPVSGEENIALAWSISSTSSKQWQKDAEIWLSMLGFIPKKIADTPALVVARTIAMLINEAADVVQQGVCTAAAVDAAMKLGVNYPKGPFEWLADWNAQSVIEVLDNLDHYYRGERYRASPWLRHLVWRESKT